MDELLFWIIASIIKAIFGRSSEKKQTSQSGIPITPRVEGSLQQPNNTGFAPPAGAKFSSDDVWEEYRRKQEALHKQDQSRAPKY